MKYQNIVVLTGAGISAESGISTFRDQNGLWENHDVMEVASPEGFRANPDLVYRFYNERRRQLLTPGIVPNEAHGALAQFEKDYSGQFTLITQNVDDLHERAGSENLFHMHGELLKMRCQHCVKVFEIRESINSETVCTSCESRGGLRPHIVWFGEMPFHMTKIQDVLGQCDLFISIGTSSQVYPAAMFVEIAKVGAGADTVELNLEVTQKSHYFDESLQGKASEIVPLYLEEILQIS